jgi:hypothetical protein
VKIVFEGVAMQIKKKSGEGDRNFKLNDDSDQLEEDGRTPASKHIDINMTTLSLNSLRQSAAGTANRPETIQVAGDKDLSLSNATSPGGDRAAFAWLKSVGGDSPELRPDGWERKAEAAVGRNEARGHMGTPLRFNKHSGWEQTQAVQETGGEDFGVEPLARKLAARFDGLVQEPRKTVVSALMPYIVATGFFVLVVGGSAFYFVVEDQSSGVRIAGRAHAVPLATLDVEGPSAMTSAGKLLDERTLSATSDSDRAPGSAAMIPVTMSEEVGEVSRIPALAPQEKNDMSLNAAAAEPLPPKLDTWAGTVETYKQFVGSNPAPAQTGEENSNNEQFLKQLEAWQNAKK